MNRPSWYSNEHDSMWDRVKSAFKRDWEQTRHDMGSDRARDLGQDAGDTVRQAAGSQHASERTFDDHEPAFRYGHAARRHFGSQHSTWNDDLESRLRSDYGDNWDRDRDSIRRAYEYRYSDGGGDAMTSDRPGMRR